MKKLAYLMFITVLLSSCYKFDFNRNNEEVDALPPDIGFGIISFTLDTLNYGNVGIEKPSKNVVLTVRGMAVAKIGSRYEAQIKADNGLTGADHKSVHITLKGEDAGFIKGTSYDTWISYYEGGATYFNFFARTAVDDIQIEGLPADCFLTTVPSTHTLNSVGSIGVSQQVTLSDFTINVDGFGGNPFLGEGFTFNVNGKPAGGFTNCLNANYMITPPLGNYGQLEPDSFTVYFDNVDFNSLIKTMSFKYINKNPNVNFHKVGRVKLYDNSGYSELRIEAVGHDGKVYREQDGKGYLHVISAEAWTYVNFVDFSGSLTYEFAFELIASDGEVLDITAGVASFETHR